MFRGTPCIYIYVKFACLGVCLFPTDPTNIETAGLRFPNFLLIFFAKILFIQRKCERKRKF